MELLILTAYLLMGMETKALVSSHLNAHVTSAPAFLSQIWLRYQKHSSFDGAYTLNCTITEQERWQGLLDSPGPMCAEAGLHRTGCSGGFRRSSRRKAGQDAQSEASGCTTAVCIAEMWKRVPDVCIFCGATCTCTPPLPLQTWCLPGFPTQAWGFLVVQQVYGWRRKCQILLQKYKFL